MLLACETRAVKEMKLYHLRSISVHVEQSKNVLREKLGVRGIRVSVQEKRLCWYECRWMRTAA